MHLSVIGTGYVGLVAGLCFAEVGNNVVCIDTSVDKIEKLNQGECIIHEPGLSELLRKCLSRKKIIFSSNFSDAFNQQHNIIFLAVGTPCASDASVDLSHFWKAIDTISEHIAAPTTIIIKSTVPVGTAHKTQARIEQKLADKKIPVSVVSNPEFLREGSAIFDFTKPERIVLGSDNKEALNLISPLYAPFSHNRKKIIHMNNASAELTKYAANTMLAAKITLINELANLADLTGADIAQVREALGTDSRIGYGSLYPGCGYGGSCFPKDIKAIAHLAKVLNYPNELFTCIDACNERQKLILVDKIAAHFNQHLTGKVFAFWGLSFKPETDDMREASSLTIISRLVAAGCSIQAYDPAITEPAFSTHFSDPLVRIMPTKEACLENADALIIVTEWKEFRTPDFELIQKTMNNFLIFDGRNIYDLDYIKSLGATYYGIGRNTETLH